jgi:Tol biopolymer transport system component
MRAPSLPFEHLFEGVKGDVMKRFIAVLTGIEVLLLGAITVTGPAEAKVSAPNGQIVYIRSDAQGNDLAYTTNPDGSNEQLLFPGKADWARWSPDGSQVDVRHSDDLAATIVDIETGTSRDLQIPDPVFGCAPTTSQEDCENTDFGCPAWSPDGARLACSGSSGVEPRRNGIYTIRSSDGGDLTLIKSCPPACGGVGDYSPDGKRLTLVGPDSSDQLRIFVMKLNGSGFTPITPAGMRLNDEDSPRWSPKGDQILFTSRPAPGFRYVIWVINADGSGLRRVPIQSCGGALADPASVGCPDAAWSPDGTKIVFTRVTTPYWALSGTRKGIYTVNADGSDPFKVTTNGVDFLPDWGTYPLIP